jgi:hypothetical protein
MQDTKMHIFKTISLLTITSTEDVFRISSKDKLFAIDSETLYQCHVTILKRLPMKPFNIEVICPAPGLGSWIQTNQELRLDVNTQLDKLKETAESLLQKDIVAEVPDHITTLLHEIDYSTVAPLDSYYILDRVKSVTSIVMSSRKTKSRYAFDLSTLKQLITNLQNRQIPRGVVMIVKPVNICSKQIAYENEKLMQLKQTLQREHENIRTRYGATNS